MKKKLWVAMLFLSLVALLCAFNASTVLAAKKFVSIASGWWWRLLPAGGRDLQHRHKNLPDIKITVESSGASVANAKLIAAATPTWPSCRTTWLSSLAGRQTMFDKPVPNIRGITSLYQEHCQSRPARMPRSPP